MEVMRDPLWITERLKQYEPRVFYFDLIECLRKLCLVGLSVFFEKGSSQNLAFGVLVTSTFLCLTVRLSPYVLVSDDLLGTPLPGVGRTWVATNGTNGTDAEPTGGR